MSEENSRHREIRFVENKRRYLQFLQWCRKFANSFAFVTCGEQKVFCTKFIMVLTALSKALNHGTETKSKEAALQSSKLTRLTPNFLT